MLTGFDKYNEEMRKFEKSHLYISYFNNFVKTIKRHGPDTPVLSVILEDRWGLKGSQIRKLVRHGRQRGLRIASSGNGYFYARSRAEYEPTLDHLRERRNSLDFLIRRGEAHTSSEKAEGLPQMDLFGGANNGR